MAEEGGRLRSLRAPLDPSGRHSASSSLVTKASAYFTSTKATSESLPRTAAEVTAESTPDNEKPDLETPFLGDFTDVDVTEDVKEDDPWDDVKDELPTTTRGLDDDVDETQKAIEDVTAHAKAAFHSLPLTAAQLPLFVVFVASVVLLIATGTYYRWKDFSRYAKYLLSVPIIPLILSACALIATRVNEKAYEAHCRWINLLCFAWSFVGACFLTMKGPFLMSGNGYFAAWVMVYGSAMTIGVTITALGGATRGIGPLMGAVTASLVLIVATIDPVWNDHPQKSEALYALILSCLTVIFGLGVATMNRMGRGQRVNTAANYFAALAAFTVWWVVMAFLVTFRGPFLATGNGYFAAWTGTLMLALAAFMARLDLQ